MHSLVTVLEPSNFHLSTFFFVSILSKPLPAGGILQVLASGPIALADPSGWNACLTLLLNLQVTFLSLLYSSFPRLF